MQARRDEILAKKAKLAELKRQRELRSTSSTRQSIGGANDVDVLPCLIIRLLTDSRLLPQPQTEVKAVQSLINTLNQYWMVGERVGLLLRDLRELGLLLVKAAAPTVF